MFLSWFGMAWAVTSAYKYSRIAQRSKSNLGHMGFVGYLWWRLCELFVRFILLGLFLAFYTPWCGGLLALHWVAMAIWIMVWQKADDRGICSTTCGNYVFHCVCAFVSIFCWVNVKEGDSRRSCAIYYLIVFVENAVMLCLLILYMFDNQLESSYIAHALWCVPPVYVLQFVCLVVYYGCCHPTRHPAVNQNSRSLDVEIITMVTLNKTTTVEY
jgi:hypothetical protein